MCVLQKTEALQQGTYRIDAHGLTDWRIGRDQFVRFAEFDHFGILRARTVLTAILLDTSFPQIYASGKSHTDTKTSIVMKSLNL